MTIDTLQTTTRADLQTYDQTYQPLVIQRAVAVWARARTDADTPRQLDLLRDKNHMVMSFFDYAGVHPTVATPQDVERWIQHLTDKGLSSGTVYGYASRLSSWYKWAMSDERTKQLVQGNPVVLARPKAPKAYNNIQALTPEEVTALLDVVPRDTVVGLRDYALLVWYLLTGHRRAEVARLKWGDLKRNGPLQVTFLIKGGDYRAEQVSETCWTVLEDYLQASNRLEYMTSDTPLWVGHGHNNDGLTPLSSHSFVKNFKRYARLAGLEDVHLHQLRHTSAAWLADEAGDIAQVQTFLGHKNLATTRVYVNSIAVKKDNHSSVIAGKLGL